MKKLLVIPVIAVALTGIGASTSFASSENSNLTSQDSLQSKETRVIKSAVISNKTYTLVNGERKVTFKHAKTADMRVHVTNKTTGTLDWYLKDSKGDLVDKGSLAAGKGFTNTYYTLSKGTYKLTVIHRNGGKGSFDAAARTME